ncbi:hypothetical protein TrST_g6605 [Triparma strigata]|uniref:RING-type domain-containing protein n=1 Tax=Triparma strigata TaxID=1606541 RepID=A0A9W7BKN6_9STRA|nr:hypothetical protein TrST_g6605 [Triparma strigata]
MVTTTPSSSPIRASNKSPKTPLTPKPECSICQGVVESMDLFSAVKLSCSHVFHSDCLSEWRRRAKVSCPNCRGEMQHEFLEGRTGVTPLFSKKVPAVSADTPNPPSLPQPPSRQRVPRQEGIYYTTPSTPNTYFNASAATSTSTSTPAPTPVRPSRRTHSAPQLTFQDLEIDVLPSLLDSDYIDHPNLVLQDYSDQQMTGIPLNPLTENAQRPKLNTPSIIRNALLDVDQWLAGCA